MCLMNYKGHANAWNFILSNMVCRVTLKGCFCFLDKGIYKKFRDTTTNKRVYRLLKNYNYEVQIMQSNV